MEGPLIFIKIRSGQAIPYDHISLALQNKLTHLLGILSRIRIISIYHQITIRIDIAKHGTNHIALSLTILRPDNCTILLSDESRVIR